MTIPGGEPGIGLYKSWSRIGLHDEDSNSTTCRILEDTAVDFNCTSVLMLTDGGQRPKEVHLSSVEHGSYGETRIMELPHLYFNQLSFMLDTEPTCFSNLCSKISASEDKRNGARLQERGRGASVVGRFLMRVEHDGVCNRLYLSTIGRTKDNGDKSSMVSSGVYIS